MGDQLAAPRPLVGVTAPDALAEHARALLHRVAQRVARDGPLFAQAEQRAEALPFRL